MGRHGTSNCFLDICGSDCRRCVGSSAAEERFPRGDMLITCFLGVAGIFILLSADFLAAMQILIYVGAIAILVILAIMLTRELSIGSMSNKFKIPAFIIAALFCAGIIWVVSKTNWQISGTSPAATTTSGLANQLFSKDGYILPVEIYPNSIAGHDFGRNRTNKG